MDSRGILACEMQVLAVGEPIGQDSTSEVMKWCLLWFSEEVSALELRGGLLHAAVRMANRLLEASQRPVLFISQFIRQLKVLSGGLITIYTLGRCPLWAGPSHLCVLHHATVKYFLSKTYNNRCLRLYMIYVLHSWPVMQFIAAQLLKLIYISSVTSGRISCE